MFFRKNISPKNRYFTMTKATRPRFELRVKHSTKLLQRRIIAGGILLLFAIAFVYWNFGVNSSSFAAAVNYTWTGTTDSLWTTSSNWTPSGVPTSNDNVTIGTSTRNPFLTANQTVNNFTENNSGTLNINGKTFQINGIASFNGGSILSSGSTGSIIAQGATTTFGTSTTSMTINPDITVTSSIITSTATTFNGTTSLTKVGASNDASAGNNMFNGNTSITTSGTGYFLMANTTRDIFNSAVNFNSTNSGIIYAAYNGIDSQFNQNINISSTSTGGIRIGANTGTSTLATGKNINVGSGGVSSGLILIGGLTTSTNQTFNFTGTSVLQLGPNATFNGDVVANCPGIVLNGATYNGIANFTKTGASNNSGLGNNTFNGATTITNSGTGYIVTSNTTRDIFNTEPNLISTSSGAIYVAYNGTGTQFNQNINVTSIGTGGVYIGASSGTSTLASGKTINVGSGGVSSGLILIGGLTTSTNQTFNFTGTSVLQLGPNATFNGDLIANCPGINLSGATYNGIANFTKTGASNNSGTGNNTFNGTTTITNSGTGYILTSQATRDIFNVEPNFISTNSGVIYLAYNGTGTQFNQNINITSTGTGGVYFGANSGTSTLATGKTINAGSGGISGGLIIVGGLTTSTNQSLTFTGTAVLQLGPNSTFNGDVIANCPGIVLSGATYNGIANFTKTGASNNSGFGNNTFNGVTSLSNSGTGYLLLAGTVRDIFNANVTITNSNTGITYLA